MTTRVRFFPLASVLLASSLLLACGGDGGTGDGSGGATSSSSDATGTTSGSGGAVPCTLPNLAGSGRLDGKTFTGIYATRAVEDDKLGQANALLCSGGWLLLAAAADIPPVTATDVTGIFKMPTSGPDPGAWYCAGKGSTYTTDKDAPKSMIHAALAGLNKLGECAGTNVAGVVVGCVNTPGKGGCPGGGDSAITSTLMSAPFTLKNTVKSSTSLTGEALILALDAGRLVLEIGSAGITGGVLQVPPGGPDGGGVYCISSGSKLQTEASGATTFTLSNLVRLGDCQSAPADDGNVAFDSK